MIGYFFRSRDFNQTSNLLVARGKLTEDDLRRAEAYVYGIPFISLQNQKIDF